MLSAPFVFHPWCREIWCGYGSVLTNIEYLGPWVYITTFSSIGSNGDGRPTSTQSGVCASPPVDLLSSTSTNEYCCSQCSDSATGMDRDSGCDSQPPSQRSTLPVPRLPVVFAQSAVPRGFEASIDHSYESALTVSQDHDYEDITDLEDSGEYAQFPPVNMKRNPSYRALRVGGRPPMSMVPNPLVMQNPAVCDDGPCAHDYLVPVSSSDGSASTSQEYWPHICLCTIVITYVLLVL